MAINDYESPHRTIWGASHNKTTTQPQIVPSTHREIGCCNVVFRLRCESGGLTLIGMHTHRTTQIAPSLVVEVALSIACLPVLLAERYAAWVLRPSAAEMNIRRRLGIR